MVRTERLEMRFVTAEYGSNGISRTDDLRSSQKGLSKVEQLISDARALTNRVTKAVEGKER